MNKNIEFTTATAHPEIENVLNIEVGELASKLGFGSTAKPEASPMLAPMLLIDVRMPHEYAGELGHIEGTQLIPLPTLPDHLSEFPKDGIIVFVCRSGARSAQASAFAHGHGFEHTFNMKGGMIQWNEQQLPVSKG